MDSGSEGKIDLFGTIPTAMGVVSFVVALIVDAFGLGWDRLLVFLFSVIGFLLGYTIWLMAQVNKQNNMAEIRALKVKHLETNLNRMSDDHQKLRDAIHYYGHTIESIASNSGKDRLDRAVSAYRETFIGRDSREQDVSHRQDT